MKPSRLRIALLAAASLTAATAAAAVAPDSPPTEAVRVDHAADHAEPRADNRVAIGVGGAALTAIAGLLSFKRIRAALRPVAAAAAHTANKAAEVSLKAVDAVGRAIASPFRFLLFVLGLFATAVIGVSVFDVEWLGGLVVGAVLTISVLLGARRARNAMRLRINA